MCELRFQIGITFLVVDLISRCDQRLQLGNRRSSGSAGIVETKMFCFGNSISES